MKANHFAEEGLMPPVVVVVVIRDERSTDKKDTRAADTKEGDQQSV